MLSLPSRKAFPPPRLASRKNPCSAGLDFHTSVAVVSALHGSHSNYLGAGERAAVVGAATHLPSLPSPSLHQAAAAFQEEPFACLGVGGSGSHGSRGVGVSCLPVQLCQRLEGRQCALAVMPSPHLRRHRLPGSPGPSAAPAPLLPNARQRKAFSEGRQQQPQQRTARWSCLHSAN